MEGGDHRWLATLGARVLLTDAPRPDLEAAAPAIAVSAGLRLVARDDLAAVQGRYAAAAGPPATMPGSDATTLHVAAARPGRALGAILAEIERSARATMLALPGLGDGDLGTAPNLEAIVGSLEPFDPSELGDPAVLPVVVSAREADAARSLLAREEGWLVSRSGAAGLAALLLVLREDRQRRPRERRLAKDRPMVVTLADGAAEDSDGPPSSADRVTDRRVSRAELAGAVRALLVEPPGRGRGREAPGE
jgi:hypothetical protein